LSAVVIGIDPSLTAAGWATKGKGTCGTIGRKEKANASYPDRLARIQQQVHDIMRTIPDAPDLICIEAPSFGAHGHGISDHMLAALWWFLFEQVCVVFGADRILLASPCSLKQFVAGTGNASKEKMLVAVTRQWPEFTVTNNNEADAVGLLKLGEAFLDRSLVRNKIQEKALASLALEVSHG
jgi:Holliday junction resolvasome RuvABC endonuclease subunit